MTYQEALDTVAKKHGFDNFQECYVMGLETSSEDLVKYCREAAVIHTESIRGEMENLDKVWRADYEIAKSVANNFEDILNQVDERLSYLEGHAHGDDGMIITELRGIIQKQIKH